MLSHMTLYEPVGKKAEHLVRVKFGGEELASEATDNDYRHRCIWLEHDVVKFHISPVFCKMPVEGYSTATLTMQPGIMPHVERERDGQSPAVTGHRTVRLVR